MNHEQLEQENAALKAKLSSLESRNPALAPQPLAPVFVDDEIDLSELWRAIGQGKWVILVITALFTTCAALYALSIPDEYKSTATLTPASASGSSSISQLAGQFGGLASLAGINLGGSGSDGKTTIAFELIKTWGFLEKFITNNNLEVEVFAGKGWDKQNKKLLIDETLYDVKASEWVRKADEKKGGQAKPSSWELFEKIEKKIDISQDKKTGFISLSVEHYSPHIAKRWVDLLIKAINMHIRASDRKEALSSIEYLNAQINKTENADMVTIFYQLIEQQTKTLMLAEIGEEYVLKTLSPAKIPEEKSKPKRALIVVLGAMLGGMLAMMIVLIRYFRNKTE